MAAKKKQQLTIEEKLKQALVPKEQQPYKISDNWCWVKIESIANLFTGNSINAKEKEAKYMNLSKGYNYIATKDVGFDTIINYENGVKIPFETNFKIAKKNTSLLCIEGGSAGRKVGFLNQDVCFVNKLCAFFPLKIEPQYLFYFLQSGIFFIEFKNNMNGLIGGVSVAKLKNMFIPLAPLNEQQRIVNIIESLFTKLDKAKALIQNTIDKFEQNKMAILHKAFTGELTANWRDENNLTLDTWKKTIMQNVCEKIVCGKTPTGYISDTGEIPYLKVYNIVDNGINFEKTPQFIPKEIHKEKLKSSILKPNDVIMNIVGPPLRKIAIIPNDYPEWNMNQAIVRFRAKRDILYKFLYYILIYPKTLDEVINKTKGVVGQANISITQSRNLEIELPTIEEQQEIVDILDKIFAKYDKIRDLKEQLEKIELLKKSILAKAFRGELGTNNPNEESAEVLLKSILNDKDI